MSSHQDISGAYYDWWPTRRPERPWRHAYHQALVDMIWIGMKGNPRTGQPPTLSHNAEQALERIRRIDRVTRGIPKIIYLVGWHHDGHDSKYPDWSEVNPRLKRKGDRTAAESLAWLMRSARAYNTTVSLHVNLLDAYENSPLWEEYVARGAIVRHAGDFYRCPWAVWGGEQAFWIDQARAWDTGLTRQRIDGLLDMLPIRELGTLHIDAFYVPWHTNPEEQKAAMRKVFRYFRDRGVDVTSELMFQMRWGDAFIGLQPMALHINGGGKKTPEIHEEQWLDIPASLYCGGVDDAAMESGQLFGGAMFGCELKDADEYRQPFCLQTLPWYLLNRHDRLKIEYEADGTRILHLSGNLVSRVGPDGRRTIRQDGRLLVDGSDVCVPAPWRPHRELIAYSKDGYTGREWLLPPAWADVGVAEIHAVSREGLERVDTVNLAGGKLALTLPAGQMVSVVPAGTERAALEAPGCSSFTGAE